MSKGLRAIGRVVVTAIGTALGGPIGALVANVAFTVVEQVAFAPKKPSSAFSGSQTQFQLDPSGGIPYAIGRTYTAGSIVHIDAYGPGDKPKNPYQSIPVVWSGGGPIDGFESFQADLTNVPFGGNAATGYYAGYLWLARQTGAQPEASALTAQFAGFPGWGASSRLSGFAAGLWTLKLDKEAKRFASGMPSLGTVLRGAKGYDPRLDSTYPGGSGPQRFGNEATWAFTENPWIIALSYAIGRRHGGKLAIGVGMPAEGLDIASFLTAANVADANGWKAGGVVYSTDDSKWNVLKLMAQAGGGEVMFAAGRIRARVWSPKVAVDTITRDDLTDQETVIPGMQTRRRRINGVVPVYRSEAHGWQLVPAATVRHAVHLAEDGGQLRTRETRMPLVQQAKQAAELAAYEIVNAREFGPIVLPCKPRMMGYLPGTVLTADLPEHGLNGQAVEILNRQIDPATGIVTLTLGSETASKHAFALGQVASPPPTAALGDPAVNDDVAANNNSTARAAYRLLDYSDFPFVGSSETSIEIRAFTATLDDGRSAAFTAATIGGLSPSTRYAVFRPLAGGAYFVEVATAASAAMASSANIYLGVMITPNAEGTYPPATTAPPGYGGSGPPRNDFPIGTDTP